MNWEIRILVEKIVQWSVIVIIGIDSCAGKLHSLHPWSKVTVSVAESSTTVKSISIERRQAPISDKCFLRQSESAAKMKSNYMCGLSCWHPAWLQRFATSRSFIMVYGFLGTTQAMAYIYFVITLTTLEKRFKIPSSTTGKDITIDTRIYTFFYLQYSSAV